MGSVRTRGKSNILFLDFRVDGKRMRVNTGLRDTISHKKRLEKKLAKVEEEIALGTFDFDEHFGVTNQAYQAEVSLLTAIKAVAPAEPVSTALAATPLFEEFIYEWFEESAVGWRESHKKNIKNMMTQHYIPAFGGKRVREIIRSDILKFRAELSKLPGRNGNETLSNNRINKIMDPLKRVFEEAADRYQFNSSYTRIKHLKIQRVDVNPFTLDEVSLILKKVRKDYQNYYCVRFFTGMRTGEIDGLKWKYVDFENRQILIRETLVDGEETYTKTNASQREISMSQPVYNALKRQHGATHHLSPSVFCNLEGKPLNHNNVTKRIWYPMLALLKLEKRRPYQSRHTTATLWLAAGEAPEWIARQMGHATTEMLFRVYSRFVPNLTRRDGSAFERLVTNQNRTDLPI
jgi:integrase